MADNFKTISDLDISFKEFMPGQIIQSAQFNDDMRDIEEKVNEMLIHKPQKIILGCTHYPYLKEIISKFYASENLLDPSKSFA